MSERLTSLYNSLAAVAPRQLSHWSSILRGSKASSRTRRHLNQCRSSQSERVAKDLRTEIFGVLSIFSLSHTQFIGGAYGTQKRTMPLQKAVGEVTAHIEGLGDVKGLLFANGVRQFNGIPYASLSKRWTRAALKTSWTNSFHDGTKLGPAAPNPKEYRGDVFLIPVEHSFEVPEEKELECLVMNITLPPESDTKTHPVMVYIHGGSFLFGGAQRPVYDCVNLVSHSVKIGSPVVAVNFNYRVGLGGFLASKAIRDELAADGLSGAGNFGLTDQQTALEWVQKYIPYFDGDKDNVTLYGESAGGMSVDHQLHAANPSIFHRAILMSGLIDTIPTWSLEHHERHFQALLEYLKIDGNAPNVLEKLRAIPESVVADATTAVAGLIGATGNPCDDGWFHSEKPTFNKIKSPPAFLKSFMVGDVYHEGIIFHSTIMGDDYNSFRSTISKFMSEEETDRILDLYGLKPEIPPQIGQLIFEDMAGDALFKTPNWLNAHRSKVARTYGYHFDQLSTLDNPVKGTAYHAIDLLYLFMNMKEKMTDAQFALAERIATAWIDFSYGKDPWEEFSVSQKWMIFGPDDKAGIKTEEEDEPVRRYKRMQAILDMGVYEKFVEAIDEIGTKRSDMGTFKPLPTGPF